jgi:hypothetical protein
VQFLSVATSAISKSLKAAPSCHLESPAGYALLLPWFAPNVTASILLTNVVFRAPARSRSSFSISKDYGVWHSVRRRPPIPD